MTPQTPRPPITAGQLAEQLLRHPDHVVQIALPRQMFVLGVGTYLENSDGSLPPPMENGVTMLVVDVGKWL